MEIEAATTEIIVPPVTSPIHGGVFGIRPSADRPHSINLFGAPHEAAQQVVSRGADLLLCVGIGAALMYYLDRDRGSQRRTALGTALEDLALTVIGRVAARVRGD
jgi:hypothetical protein